MAGKVQMIFEGDGKKLEGELDKMRTKLRTVEGQFGKLKAAGQAAGKSGVSAADKMGTAFGALGAATGPIAAAGMMVATLKKNLDAVNAEAARSAETLKTAADPLSKLAQLSGGGQAGLDQRMRLARDLAIGGGMGLDASAQTVFDATSLGISENEVRGLFGGGRLGKEFIPAALRGGGKLREAFGAKETGSLMEIVNKALAAAAPSDVDFSGIMMNVLGFAPSAARIGTRDEEALAALSILSGPGGKEPAEAATLIGAFTGMIGKARTKDGPFRGFEGGIGEAVRLLGGMSEEDRKGVLGGRKEASAAFGLLRVRQDLLRERTAEIDAAALLTGTAESPFRQAVERAGSNPILGALFRNRQAEVGRAMAEAGAFGPERLNVDALIDEYAERSINTGEGRYLRAARQGGALAGQYVGEVLGAGEAGARFGHAAAGGSELQLFGIIGQFAGFAKSLADILQEFSGGKNAPVEDNRTQIFYGAKNGREQMRSPSGRIDPSTGR